MSERIRKDDFYAAVYHDPLLPFQAECSDDEVPVTEEVTIPEVITMKQYLFNRYRLRMYSYLNQCLRNGYLGDVTGYKLLNQVINRNVCRFGYIRYWRVDQYNFLADVDTDLKLLTTQGKIVWKGCLTFLFSVEGPEMTYEIEGLYERNDMPGRNYITLSQYLVPYCDNRKMDVLGEKIWQKYLPEALVDRGVRRAEDLAKRMGLTVRYLPVHRHDRTGGILFLEGGTLTVKDEMMYEDEREETIDAGTIVINTNVLKRQYSYFQIYHECIHYELHYLFYRLQKLYNNDSNNVKTKKVMIKDGEKKSDPLFFMEKQANRGAYGLMLPAEEMRQLIRLEHPKVAVYRNAGELYEKIGKALSIKLGHPHFHIRARMIQLGYIHAKGALNYICGKLIDPFSFDADSCRNEKHTFVIDISSLISLEEKNEAFRKLLASGRYVYADGHIVRNDPRFVTDTLEGNKLTEHALRRVDLCCLRFEKVYVQKSVGVYILGQMNLDMDYIRQTNFYIEDKMNECAFDEIDAQERYVREFPNNFREAFNQLRQKCGYSMESAAEKLNMTVKTLHRWLNDPGKWTPDFIVMVCLMFKAPDWLSSLMLDRGFVHLSDADYRHKALKYILRTMYMDGLDKANEYLISKRLSPLSV